MRQVDLLYHFPLSPPSSFLFLIPIKSQHLVNIMLEVEKELVCATQMVGSDKEDSTFLPSCVKVQMGCILCCSVGHSEDVWTMCSGVG